MNKVSIKVDVVLVVETRGILYTGLIDKGRKEVVE